MEVLGIISEKEVKEQNIPIIAPEGFEKYAIQENIYAGTAMTRSAGYQYGIFFPKCCEGAMAISIGMGQCRGTISYISPTESIKETGEVRIIDGVKMEFQMIHNTEAPVEMNTWFPEKKALWMAENCTRTLHNLHTSRGAEVRDGNAWVECLMESLECYGTQAEVVFQAHNWPHFGNAVIQKYMENTATIYKFINDQNLLYINQGYTLNTIAEMITLPEELNKVWYTRQYYGTMLKLFINALWDGMMEIQLI